MLAMVSQKSMKRIGIDLDNYEASKPISDKEIAARICEHLNRVISLLIEADEIINIREFDLWRGMAAGSQAQGSWQNNKGTLAEIAIREVILLRLQELKVGVDDLQNQRIALDNDRTLVFADDPE